MILNNSIFIIFFLFKFLFQNILHDKDVGNFSDVYTTTIYMRENYKITVDTKNLLSYYSSSVNFSSNNQNVKLPGIREDINNNHFLKDYDFNPLVLKHTDNNLFILGRDKRSFIIFDLEIKDFKFNYKKINSKITFMIASDPYINCNDMLIHGSYIFLLCYNQEDFKEKNFDQKYYFKIIMVNYHTDEIIIEDKIETHWMQNPHFKILEPLKKLSKKNKNIHFFLFDKEKDPHIQLEHGKKIIFFSIIKKVQEGMFYLGEPRVIFLDELLFDRQSTAIKLLNVYTVSDNVHEIFFLFKRMLEDKQIKMQVYHCEVIYQDELSELEMKKCNSFIKREITDFFMRENIYTYITHEEEKKDTMVFGILSLLYEKKGIIEPDWDIKSILIEGNYSVIVMMIKKTYVIFVNEFITNSLVWFYMDVDKVSYFSLFKKYNPVTDMYDYYLLGVQEHGFIIKRLTIFTNLVVNTSNLTGMDPVVVYLDDKKIIDLDLKIWDGKSIVNKFEDHQELVLLNSDDSYMIRLGFLGKNLHFNYAIKYNIFHFNDSQVEFIWKKGEAYENLGKFRMSSQGDFTFLIFKRVIYVFGCHFFNLDLKLVCIEKFKIDIGIINLEEYIKSYMAGNMLLLSFKYLEDFTLINIFTKQKIKLEIPAFSQNEIPQTEDGNYCIFKVKYYSCIFVDVRSKTEFIKLFEIVGNKLIEIENFGKTFIDLILKVKEERNQPVDKITISNFEVDYINFETFHVLFNFIKDSKFDPVQISFSFKTTSTGEKVLKIATSKLIKEPNPNLKSSMKMIAFDNQVVLFTDRPTFSMICYDEWSYYTFEYIDVLKFISFDYLYTHNLLLIFYQGDLDMNYYFALFKITNNSINQLVRHEKVLNYSEDFAIKLLKIQKDKILIVQYNKSTHEFYQSYTYFTNGPYIMTKEMNPKIKINSKYYQIFTQPDLLLNREVFRYREENSISLDSPDHLLNDQYDSIYTNITNHVILSGNLHQITLKNDTFGITDIKINQPLTLKEELHLAEIDAKEFGGSIRNMRYNDMGEFIIYKNGIKPIYFINYKESNKKNSMIEFSLPNDTRCDEIFKSEVNLFCSYTLRGQYMIGVKSLINPRAKMWDFEIIRDGYKHFVIKDSETEISISCIGKDDKFLAVNTIKIGNSVADYFYIGRKKLEKDDLFISEYHVTVHDQRDRLTFIIFDISNNSVYFYHSLLSDSNYFSIINNKIDLNEYNKSFENMICNELNINNFIWECKLFGSHSIVELYIYKGENPKGVSKFVWEHSLQTRFSNVFYENSYDQYYDIISTEDKNYFFICDRNIFLKQHTIAMYRKTGNSLIKHSYYILNLEEDFIVKDIKIENQKILNVYGIKDQDLLIRKYKIGKYQLFLKNRYQFKDKTVDLIAHFIKTDYEIKILVEEITNSSDEYQDRSSLIQNLLMSGIIILSFIILLTLFYLVKLVKKRKKMRLKSYQTIMNSINNSVDNNSASELINGSGEEDNLM